jgi:transcription-repair coupling factor (superfamily II helicase)
MELLDRAVRTLKEGREPDLDLALEPGNREVNLHEPTLIPEQYLPDVHSRLIFYKRIANATTTEALEQLQAEMIDRFGLLPPPLTRLFQVSALRTRLAPLGIGRLELGDRGGKIEFNADTRVDPIAIVNLVQSQPHSYRLDGGSMLRITAELESFAQRLEFADKLIDLLAGASGDTKPARAATA